MESFSTFIKPKNMTTNTTGIASIIQMIIAGTIPIGNNSLNNGGIYAYNNATPTPKYIK